MDLISGLGQILTNMVRDSLWRSKGWEHIDQPEKIYLELWLTHRPLHESTVPVSNVEWGELIFVEVSEHATTKRDDLLV
jgi:hypothetical protein